MYLTEITTPFKCCAPSLCIINFRRTFVLLINPLLIFLIDSPGSLLEFLAQFRLVSELWVVLCPIIVLVVLVTQPIVQIDGHQSTDLTGEERHVVAFADHLGFHVLFVLLPGCLHQVLPLGAAFLTTFSSHQVLFKRTESEGEEK